MQPGLDDPVTNKTGVAARERLFELLDQTAVLGQRLAQWVRVLEKDVNPDAGIGAGHARHVSERATRAGKRLVPLHARRAGLVDQQVGERMRKMTGQREATKPCSMR